jgi:hypothetical protein
LPVAARLGVQVVASKGVTWATRDVAAPLREEQHSRWRYRCSSEGALNRGLSRPAKTAGFVEMER